MDENIFMILPNHFMLLINRQITALTISINSVSRCKQYTGKLTKETHYVIEEEKRKFSEDHFLYSNVWRCVLKELALYGRYDLLHMSK